MGNQIHFRSVDDRLVTDFLFYFVHSDSSYLKYFRNWHF